MNKNIFINTHSISFISYGIFFILCIYFKKMMMSHFYFVYILKKFNNDDFKILNMVE
jgi:hypothetical protein